MSVEQDSEELIDAATRRRFGFSKVLGSPASMLPYVEQEEQRMTSWLLATLEMCRPFAQEFYDYLDISGPSRATKRTGTYGALALVEPTLALRGNGREPTRRIRPDGAISFVKGSRPPSRSVLEVKYLQLSRSRRVKPAKLQKAQVQSTFRAARHHDIDHFITVSAAEWDGHSHPSGFVPDGRRLRGTALVHISWLGVLRVIQATRRRADVTEDQNRILGDFERHLRASEIWAVSRSMSMTSAFTRVRSAVRARAREAPFSLDPEDVKATADRWVRLTEVVAHILSIETTHEVEVARSRRRTPSATDRAERLIQRKGVLRSSFELKECRLGAVHVTVNLAEGTASAEWTISIPELADSTNPLRSTRWRLVREHLLTPRRTRRGHHFKVLDEDGHVIVEGPLRQAAARLTTAETGSTRPERVIVARVENPRTLKSTGLPGLIEGLVASTSAW